MEESPLTTKPGMSPSAWRGVKWSALLSAPFWAIIGIIIYMSCQSCTHKPLPPATSIILHDVSVHITDDRTAWPVSARRFEVAGCASSGMEIWVLRELFKDQLTAERVLGHELWHLLNWKDIRMRNPDKE